MIGVTKRGWFGAALCVLTTWTAHAGVFSYFDIDGTLFHDSGLYEGKLPAFRTPWVLTRLASPNNGFGLAEFDSAVISGALPDTVLVTRHEIDNILVGRLAQGEAQTGSLETVALTPIPSFSHPRFLGMARPKELIPGYYRIVDPLAYRFHRDMSPGENVLLDAFLDAFDLTQADPKKYAWKGSAFSHFQHAVRDQGPDSRVFLISDRDSRQSSIDALVKKLHEVGELTNPMVTSGIGADAEVVSPRMVSMSDARARRYGTLLDFHARKAERIASDAAAISRSALIKHKTLAPDFNQANQGIMQDMHEFRIYENDPEKVGALLRKARDLAIHYPDIKFSLFHAGDESQVAAADYNRGQAHPSRWVIFTPSGIGWRHPLGAELKALEVKGCSHAFK